ncbi:MAG: hypothetical protein D6778_01040 [Nitrospirae bacterium]|nr:MAG: hypothetical protein D6778_01040 [Nitrospirota bacterium]
MESLKVKLRTQYKEITENITGKNRAVAEFWPDLVLSEHGFVLAAVEVETEGTITEESAKKWKAIVESGTKLILMVPAAVKKKTTELLWEEGLADKVSVGTYELKINMP